MSQRREVEARLALYDELSGILGAMRSFALAELRKVGKRESAQQHVLASVAQALGDLTGQWPPDASDDTRLTGTDTWLLLGSTRGFCGSFNEDIKRFWREHAPADAPLIVFGERLQSLFDPMPNAVYLAGAEGGLEAASAIDRILEAVNDLQNGSNLGLVACWRDDRGACSRRLWPLPLSVDDVPLRSTLTFSPIADVVSGVAKHYLFHSLLALLLCSIRVENHMRLMQMETALQYLARNTEDLQQQRNRLRQEEIVEEIELIVGRR